MRRRELVKISALAGAVGAASYTGVGLLDTKPASLTAEPTDTASPTASPTQAPTETATPEPTSTKADTETATSSPTESPTTTDSPTPTQTDTPTATESPTPTETPSPTPTETPTPSPTATPAPEENIEVKAYASDRDETGQTVEVYNYNDYHIYVEISVHWKFSDGTESQSGGGKIGPYADDEFWYATNRQDTVLDWWTEIETVERR